MTVYLYPTLRAELACPSRYTRSKVRREYVPAPFASSFYGRVVHHRIAHSLRNKVPLDQSPILLPARVIVSDGDELAALAERARRCLEYFAKSCLPWLRRCDAILAIEHRAVWYLERDTRPIRFSGILDLIVKTPAGQLIVDWKTGSVAGSQNQLRCYLALRYHETRCQALQARAISLTGNEEESSYWNTELEGWMLSELDQMIAALATIEAQPDKLVPGPHCRYCPYAHDCPASSAGPRTLLDTRSGKIIAL